MFNIDVLSYAQGVSKRFYCNLKLREKIFVANAKINDNMILLDDENKTILFHQAKLANLNVQQHLKLKKLYKMSDEVKKIAATVN
jgi:hypothetical protein